MLAPMLANRALLELLRGWIHSCDRVRAGSSCIALCVGNVLSVPTALMARYLSSCAETCAHSPK